MLSAAPYHCRGRVPSPPGGLGWRNSPFCWRLAYLVLLFHPISLVLPKETGWSPKEKRFWVVAPP